MRKAPVDGDWSMALRFLAAIFDGLRSKDGLPPTPDQLAWRFGRPRAYVDRRLCDLSTARFIVRVYGQPLLTRLTDVGIRFVCGSN